jgi:hypothetical protein
MAKKPGPMLQLTTEQRHAVNEFVEALFTAGNGEAAGRLVLWQDSTQRDLGGWSRGPIKDRVAELVLHLCRSAPAVPQHAPAVGEDGRSPRDADSTETGAAR